jgi:hypothetical protein
VFPLYQKKPAVTRWRQLQERLPGDRAIGKMFEQAARVDGVAAVTGPVSHGLCVRDFDTTDGYLAWARARPNFARRLPTARTGRGFHVYIRLPKGFGPVYKAWRSGTMKGELLGTAKRYIVLPPSLHPSSKRYAWVWKEPFKFRDLPVFTPEDVGWLDNHNDHDDHPQHEEPPTKTAHVLLNVICNNKGGQSFPLEVVERDAVQKCVPTGPGERNDCLWQLARTLKAFPHLTDADEGALWPFIEQWFQLAQHVITTKSLEACWKDFKRQWKLVKVPAGQGFDSAISRILTQPYPPEADEYEDEPTKRLVAVCAGLQAYAGDAVFFLSCRTAQRVCGFGSHMTASRRLSELVEAGPLVVAWKGKGGTDRRKATRYRWAGKQGVPSRTHEPAVV